MGRDRRGVSDSHQASLRMTSLRHELKWHHDEPRAAQGSSSAKFTWSLLSCVEGDLDSVTPR